MYKLDYTDEAKVGMRRLKYDEPKAFEKLGKLLEELMDPPRLSSVPSGGRWARGKQTGNHRR